MTTDFGTDVVFVSTGDGNSGNSGRIGGAPPKGSGAGGRRRLGDGKSGVYVQRGMVLYLPIKVEQGKIEEGGPTGNSNLVCVSIAE